MRSTGANITLVRYEAPQGSENRVRIINANDSLILQIHKNQSFPIKIKD